MRRSIFLLALVATLPLGIYSQLATTPPMGWNSWDSYGMTITEQEFRQNVGWLHAHLQRSGWQYVVIDEGWFLASPQKANQGYTLDANGRYIPAPDRFPSADKGRGFKPLADYVHSLGLKFGIHIIRGISKEAVARNLPIAGSNYRAAEAADTSDTCRWNHDNYGVRDNAAGQAYYDSIAKLYAGWGVDFVKVDCISQPYKTASIHMMSRALRETGRPIVLSLSPGPTPLADASDVVQQAQMWRISDDFWDVWSRNETSGDFPQSVVHQFPLLAQWERYAGPGHWPDADMLPIGWLGPQPGYLQARPSRLTPNETRTVLTLWAIARSPLILGANLTRMDSATEAMLTNQEALAVDQNSTDNRALLHTSTTWVWTARATSAKGDYVALFNVSDAPIDLHYTWRDLDIPFGSHVVHDLWLHKALEETGGITVMLAPHGSALYRVE
ncbi:MAG TPA: glycoside hydrolase family 27 protein [Acidobacteriaceae bacterium]|nr:glycoside hydrolase family 27 protein [Acidobacteriaceae bacterium]